MIFVAGDPVELLENYYVQFGDKYCCFSDLRAYLEILNTEEQAKVCTETRNTIFLKF